MPDDPTHRRPPAADAGRALSPDEDLFGGPAGPGDRAPIPLRPAAGGLAHDDELVERMSAEIEAGFRALAAIGPAVSIFGSARTPSGHPEYALARTIAERIGREGLTVITGGGPGAMEAANRGARDGGALSVGLTIDLVEREQINPYLDLPVHFRYFFARKLMFIRFASAFVVLPGGLGTLDELFELAALIQTHKVAAPPVVLVGRAYWGPLVDWLRDTVLAGGKISAPDLDLFALADTVEEVIAGLASAIPEALPRRDAGQERRGRTAKG